MSKDKSPISLDVILKELGPFGTYNIYNYVLLLFPCFLAGMYGSVYVFETLNIDYRCQIDECEGTSNKTIWLPYAIPQEETGPSKCSRYSFSEIFNNTNDWCDFKSFDTSVKVKCTSYVYYGDSVVKDFDLACEDWKRTLVGTIHNSGHIIAIPLSGVISDRYGRKVVLPMAALINSVFGILRSFSINYYMLVVCEFLESALGAGAYSTAFVLAMELVTPPGRVIGNTLVDLSYISGLITLAGLAWLFNDWRTLLRVIYAPSCLIVSYLWVLNESPRWLLSKDRHEEAVKVLKKAAKMNKLVLTDHRLASINDQRKENTENSSKKGSWNQNTGIGTNSSEEVEKKTSLFVRVIKSRIILTRVVSCSFLWITCTFVYYGLSINSVSLAGNLYVNFMLVSFIEMPANACYLLVSNRYGRKKVLITTYALSAIFCISLSFLPKDLSWWPLIIFLAGKFSITIAYATVYVYVSEVFPTQTRQSLLAICSSVGRIGSTLAPLTPLMALYYENLPSILFGIFGVFAGLLVFTLPETLNQTLPDTIEEAERLSREKNKRQLA